MKNKLNKKERFDKFTIIGICFMGVGVTFLSAVNKVLGMAFLALGISYIAIGVSRQKRGKKNGKHKTG